MATETVNYADPITFSYDNDGLLNGAGAMTLTRDPDHGMVTGSQLGEVVDLTEHNDFGELSHCAASEGINVLLDILYDRDKAGRIKKKTETVIGGAGPVATYYKYDSRGRLHRVCSSDVCGSGDVLSEYLYGNDPNDPNDPGHNSNRTGGFTSAGSITATYDDQDRLLGYNGTTYTYSANGELETKTDGSGTTSYVYDALGNLRQAMITDTTTTPDTVTTIEYVIDGQNRRIGKKVNGVLVQGFLYENQLRIVAELDGDGNVRSRFVYGDKVNVPEYMIRNGQTYRLITDHLGSPRLVVNTATGDVVQQIDYDEFGKASLVIGEWGFQPFGFAGRIYDRDTKLTRFGARDYDAQTGRWTVKDPLGFGGLQPNLYGYVTANPANDTDVSGLGGALAAKCIAGAIGGGLGSLFFEPSEKEIFLNALGGCVGGVLGVKAAAIIAMGAAGYSYWDKPTLGFAGAVMASGTFGAIGSAAGGTAVGAAVNVGFMAFNGVVATTIFEKAGFQVVQTIEEMQRQQGR